MAKRYIYIKREKSIENTDLFSDFKKLDNMDCIKIKKKPIKSFLLKFLRKIHLSQKISKFVQLPMKSIWYDTSEMKIDDYNEYIIFMLPNVFLDYDISILKKYKKLKNLKFVLILLDTVGVDTPVGRIVSDIYQDKMWNYIFSYDLNDVKKYGFEYLDECYYSNRNIEKSNKILTDAYFIGALKPGRTQEIISVCKECNKNNILSKFDVVKQEGISVHEHITGLNVLNKRKKYIDILKDVANTNCIIEILQKGQNSQTLRYFEAVYFNKKLLTTNENVKKLSFYDERYMKVFRDANDIDFNWIKRRENINYNYNNEFSPIHIIEKVEELEKNERKVDKS